MDKPPVVSAEEWQQARDALLTDEKQATGPGRDRRTAPPPADGQVPSDYEFASPSGCVVNNMLDLAPYGRQQDWEDSPPGWPQHPTYG